MRRHKVAQGECLTRIAQSYGVMVEAIWKLSENDHLREGRRSEDILLPGDIVHVPEPKKRSVAADTDKLHSFRRKGKVQAQVQLRLLFESEPRSGRACKLVLDGLPDSPELPGTTDEKGVVKFMVPLEADEGILKIGEDEALRVRFGHINPTLEVSGAQQRLFNLGYAVEPSGEMDEDTREALLSFQQEAEITETGELDDRTAEALEKEYGA